MYMKDDECKVVQRKEYRLNI